MLAILAIPGIVATADGGVGVSLDVLSDLDATDLDSIEEADCLLCSPKKIIDDDSDYCAICGETPCRLVVLDDATIERMLDRISGD